MSYTRVEPPERVCHNCHAPNPRGAGRPKLDKRGKMVWVKAEYIEIVTAFIQMLDDAKAKLRM